jgi:hypothetical protein
MRLIVFSVFYQRQHGAAQRLGTTVFLADANNLFAGLQQIKEMLKSFEVK